MTEKIKKNCRKCISVCRMPVKSFIKICDMKVKNCSVWRGMTHFHQGFNRTVDRSNNTDQLYCRLLQLKMVRWGWMTSKHLCMYIWGFRARQHLRSFMMDDYDGQMIFGDLEGLKIPDIRLTGEEKHRKKPRPGSSSRPGIEPGPAARQARMLPLVSQRWTRNM